MPRAASRRAGVWIIGLLAAALTAAVFVLVGGPVAGEAIWADKAVPPSPPPAEPVGIEPAYSVQAGVDGEIFPALANYASLQRPRERKLGTISVRILNSTDHLLKNRVAVQVPGWSDQEIQAVEVAAGESRTLQFAPTFYQRLYTNREIAPATAVITATDTSGKVTYSGTLPVRLRAAEDMYWGADFKYAPFIASWVTPHDPQVEEVLSRAKEYAPGRRLPGYEHWKNTAAQVNATYVQARAIYRAVQEKGLSYVKSSMTFGQHAEISERVRFPRESLRRVSANCIDGAVMYASLFENLGLDPVVVLVPGHAYVGVREAQSSQNYLYIETSLTGRASFETAVLSASRGLRKHKPQDILRIPIGQSRQAGIYPMPIPAAAPARTGPSTAALDANRRP